MLGEQLYGRQLRLAAVRRSGDHDAPGSAALQKSADVERLARDALAVDQHWPRFTPMRTSR